MSKQTAKTETITGETGALLSHVEYRLALELAAYISAEGQRYKHQHMREMLSLDGRKKPNKKWLKKFNSKKRQKIIRKVFNENICDGVIDAFWQAHQYDLLRLNQDQMDDIEIKAYQIMRNKEAHSEAIDMLLEGRSLSDMHDEDYNTQDINNG